MEKIKQKIVTVLLLVWILFCLIVVFSRIFFNENIFNRWGVERALNRNISYIFELWENERASGNEVPFTNIGFVHLIRPFEWRWTDVYIFEPGTTRAEIEEVVGIRSLRTPRIVREGYTQIIIVHVNRIAANIHSNNKAYEFCWKDSGGDYFHLALFERHRINLTRSEETDRIIVRFLNVETDNQ